MNEFPALTCPTRPSTDSSNACASTAFVANAIAASTILTVLRASVNLNGNNIAWVPPSPTNKYHLFIPQAIAYNPDGLYINVPNVSAAFVPPTGTKLVRLTGSVWITAGIKAQGLNPTVAVKWIKNATVDVNGNLNSGGAGGTQVGAGVGAMANFAADSSVCRADVEDIPSPGDYYNLFMFADPVTLGVTSITVDGNPFHTYAQISAFK